MSALGMKRADAPAHAELASFPEPVRLEDLASELDRLDALTLECAQSLLEGNWRAAARSAYTAAWSYHRLPEAEQRAFVTSDLHDDAGPLPVNDEWSASAFVAWMIYRMGTSAQPFVRYSSGVHKAQEVCTPVESEQKGLGL